MSAVAAIDLDFGYPGHPVGRGVSFTFGPGEVVCLLGPNGRGKTTFFRTRLGLIGAQGGRVTIGGEDIARLARREIAKRLSYVPQAHAGYFPFTVRDVVTMGRTAHLPAFAGPTSHDEAIALDALERVHLSHLAEQPYTRISGGERQLALIARALAQQAPLVVMDEPTASLDFGNQVRVLAEVKRLKSDGVGVLMSTHDPDHAFLCADRVALIHDGRLVADAPPAVAITPQALRDVYGIDVEVRDVPTSDGSLRRVCVPAFAPHPRRL